ncbi:uncharacterized protein BCR38DRAFT_24601 [Pseudomassariella vexata]|uniref:Uncharacterized protein n=1 Tax=Pseudomassariella vexata TaxID=1141098 RepID=A0A1Y2EK94_9PEZI|nr:uncharacterized protein BCR38DRAFT_24601 [Pseudomassariella vexata]ORY71969.1 hypothetical protein BCR38DRAFT_24601 [Pseudomassariella vexata]
MSFSNRNISYSHVAPTSAFGIVGQTEVSSKLLPDDSTSKGVIFIDRQQIQPSHRNARTHVCQICCFGRRQEHVKRHLGMPKHSAQDLPMENQVVRMQLPIPISSAVLSYDEPEKVSGSDFPASETPEQLQDPCLGPRSLTRFGPDVDH